MAETKKTQLTWKRGLRIFAISWAATFALTWALRQAFIPKDEMACYGRVCSLDGAVKAWNKAHPEKTMDEKGEIDEPALVSGGFLKAVLSYDKERHYYFVENGVHGPRVKCNKHDDNPLVLKLTGVTLLAVLGFVFFCASRNYVFWVD